MKPKQQFSALGFQELHNTKAHGLRAQFPKRRVILPRIDADSQRSADYSYTTRACTWVYFDKWHNVLDERSTLSTRQNFLFLIRETKPPVVLHVRYSFCNIITLAFPLHEYRPELPVTIVDNFHESQTHSKSHSAGDSHIAVVL